MILSSVAKDALQCPPLDSQCRQKKILILKYMLPLIFSLVVFSRNVEIYLSVRPSRSNWFPCNTTKSKKMNVKGGEVESCDGMDFCTHIYRVSITPFLIGKYCGTTFILCVLGWERAMQVSFEMWILRVPLVALKEPKSWQLVAGTFHAPVTMCGFRVRSVTRFHWWSLLSVCSKHGVDHATCKQVLG